jgi:hypothetical protein
MAKLMSKSELIQKIAAQHPNNMTRKDIMPPAAPPTFSPACLRAGWKNVSAKASWSKTGRAPARCWPRMWWPRRRRMVERFGAMLLEIPAFAGVYGAI